MLGYYYAFILYEPSRLEVGVNYSAYCIRSFMVVLTQHLMESNKYASWMLLLGLWAPANTQVESAQLPKSSIISLSSGVKYFQVHNQPCAEGGFVLRYRGCPAAKKLCKAQKKSWLLLSVISKTLIAT